MIIPLAYAKIQTMKELKKNQIFSVEIESYSSDGYGVCRVEGRAVFVPRAIVGEQWETISSSDIVAPP